jgi:hypothetical protein
LDSASLNLYLRYSKGCLSKELSSKAVRFLVKKFAPTANSQQPTANSQQPTAKARYRLPGINNHDALLVSTMHYRDAKVEENCIDHVCNMAPAWRVPMT